MKMQKKPKAAEEKQKEDSEDYIARYKREQQQNTEPPERISDGEDSIEDYHNDPERVIVRGDYDDFIGTYREAIDPAMCKDIIKAFDYYQSCNSTFCEDDQFPDSCAGRFDYALDLSHMTVKTPTRLDRELNIVLNGCLREYTHVFGHMKGCPLYSTTQKVQMTPAGGGYHVWHDENSGLDACDRMLVWMLYLNDDFEGGETEFLYYKKRIQPTAGTVLIWPAGMTHCHKGNMVLTGTKYIVTGWFNVTEKTSA